MKNECDADPSSLFCESEWEMTDMRKTNPTQRPLVMNTNSAFWRLVWLGFFLAIMGPAYAIKRHPADPSVVFGDDWKISHWVYGNEFLGRRDGLDPAYIDPELPASVYAMELRVEWEPRHYRYRCHVNLFYKPELKLSLPLGEGGHWDTGPDIFPGTRLKQDDYRFATSLYPRLYAIGYIGNLLNIKGSNREGLAGGLETLKFRRSVFRGIDYVAMGVSCNALSDPRTARNELWLRPVDGTEGQVSAPSPGLGETVASSSGKRDVLIPISKNLAMRAYPYWHRADQINSCYRDQNNFENTPSDRWLPGFKEKRREECEALRTSDIREIR